VRLKSCDEAPLLGRVLVAIEAALLSLRPVHERVHSRCPGAALSLILGVDCVNSLQGGLEECGSAPVLFGIDLIATIKVTDELSK
jgi:hypothetical protein